MPDPRLGLAQKYALSGLYDDAWQTLQGALPDSEGDVRAYRLAATVQVERGEFESAIVFCRKALAIDARHDETQFNLALALEKTGQLESACEVYRRVIALNAAHALTWNNLGTVLDRLGRTQEAMDAYRQAMALKPDDASIHNNLGVALLGQGQLAAARDAFKQALNCEPSNVNAFVNLGVTEVEIGAVKTGQSHFENALKYQPDNREAWDNALFSLHYECEAPDELVARHRAWGAQYAPIASQSADRNPTRKLRVGYVSPDFKRHSVAFFTEPLITAHNRDAIEVYCYSNGAVSDIVTARFQRASDHWRNIAGLSAAKAADIIRNDRIDILVDLAGHTLGNRLDIFALRAAPVQVTGLGYPDTTGLPAMDARVVDAITDPDPAANAWASECLIRLSHLHCYAPPETAPAIGELPAAKNGYVTFGSFNKRAKISVETIRMWAAILTAVPKSRLLLKAKALSDESVSGSLRADFQRQGVAAERLEILGWAADDAAHMGLYQNVDLALDTYPYNGTTTTCEALWMGVPVITRAGLGHASRVGASILSSVGLPDLICDSAAQYVRKAAAVVMNLEALASQRAGLRAQMAASPLCQAQPYAASVEAAYRRLWAAFCAR